MGSELSSWKVRKVLLEENGDCGPSSRKASQVPRTGSVVPEEQSISAGCGTGKIQA